MKRIIISGYYGFGNIGDEAVLSGICATLNQLGVNAEITVLSADPARTVREHPGVSAVKRYGLAGIIAAMLRADLLISGGGSLFQDTTSARSPYYYLTVLRLAQMMRRKTMVYAQGVGPLIRPGIRKAVANAFSRADVVTVRDADSQALLREIGVSREVGLSADPSFLVEPDLEAADRVIGVGARSHFDTAGTAGLLSASGVDMAEEMSGRRPLVGICLRAWPGHEAWIAAAARELVELCEELGATAVFIPMQEPEDADVTDGGVILRHGGNPCVAKGLIARCEMVVGMRLHSLIFAAGSGVPFVPVAYDPKVSSFAAEAGQSAGVAVGSVNPGALAAVVRETWTTRRERAEALSARASELTKLARVSGESAANLLG